MSRIRQGGFGHGRITPPAINLARNPLPVDLSGFGFVGTPGGTTTVLVSSGGPFGGPFVRVTWGGASTASNTDFLLYADNAWVAGSGTSIAGTIPVRPDDVHVLSVYVRMSRSNPMFVQAQYVAGSGGAQGASGSSAVSPVANTWTRLSGTGVAGVDAQALRFDVDLGGPVSWQAGDTLDLACFMISQGPELLPFSTGFRREM